MNIIICVKQALDSTQDIRLTEEGRIYEKGVSYVLNDWDNYALEEALLTKEKLSGSLTAITVGPERADQVLKECLAKGADKAIRIWDRAIEGSDGHALAGILCEVIKRMKYDLIFCLTFRLGCRRNFVILNDFRRLQNALRPKATKENKHTLF